MKQLLIILVFTSAFGAQAQKQHFQRVDHNFILQKIAKTNPGTWSLSENSNTRHYGLTDKEFFKNFGNDRVGKIGTPARVENYDKIGLNYVSIHALGIENKKLKTNLKQTKDELNLVRNALEKLEQKITVLEKTIQKEEKYKKAKEKRYGTN